MNSKKTYTKRATLKYQKTKRRSLTPEPTIDEVAQDVELNLQLQKKVHLGDDFLPEFEKLLQSGEIKTRVENAIEKIVSDRNQ